MTRGEMQVRRSETQWNVTKPKKKDTLEGGGPLQGGEWLLLIIIAVSEGSEAPEEVRKNDPNPEQPERNNR